MFKTSLGNCLGLPVLSSTKARAEERSNFINADACSESSSTILADYRNQRGAHERQRQGQREWPECELVRSSAASSLTRFD
jgi:hypothetical protein